MRALELFRQSPSNIDLVITDLVMPGMSGRELSDHIRRLAPAVPILSTSGYVRPSSDDKEDEYYLRKPYTTQDCCAKSNRCLLWPRRPKLTPWCFSISIRHANRELEGLL